MPSILQQLLGDSRFQIIDLGTSSQVWSALKVKSIEVGLPATIAEVPLATKDLTEAQVYVDLLDVDVKNAKILNPVKIRVTAYAEKTELINSILQAFASAERLFDIHAKDIIASNMTLLDVGIFQDANIISASILVLEFEQSSPPIFGDFDPANPSNESNYGVSVQSPQSATAKTIAGYSNKLTSATEALYNKVSSFFGL